MKWSLFQFKEKVNLHFGQLIDCYSTIAERVEGYFIV